MIDLRVHGIHVSLRHRFDFFTNSNLYFFFVFDLYNSDKLYPFSINGFMMHFNSSAQFHHAIDQLLFLFRLNCFSQLLVKKVDYSIFRLSCYYKFIMNCVWWTSKWVLVYYLMHSNIKKSDNLKWWVNFNSKSQHPMIIFQFV